MIAVTATDNEQKRRRQGRSPSAVGCCRLRWAIQLNQTGLGTAGHSPETLNESAV
jgi:hypothetical protein